MDSNFQYAGAVNLVVALPVVHVPRRARSALACSSSRKLLPLALEAARNETIRSFGLNSKNLDGPVPIGWLRMSEHGLTREPAGEKLCPEAPGQEIVMSVIEGTGIVLQPEEGQAYWQPIWANGYSIVKLSPKHGGPDDLAMGVQVIAPGGYVREHSHTPNQEILFCFEGKGTILVDGVPHPFVPGTTVYAGPGVKHKIINDGPGELKMTWTYLPPGVDDFFAAIGRPRRPGEPAPKPFERPADVHAIEARTGYGPPMEG